ncbi:MAG: hypothetical protein R3290_12240, partial [Acidimicrobiia bacterium]|nr:hypothetical protein [Acidimicrobiia bacterium]
PAFGEEGVAALGGALVDEEDGGIVGVANCDRAEVVDDLLGEQSAEVAEEDEQRRPVQLLA